MLEFAELKAESRNEKQTRAVQKLRRQGRIPGILYGKGIDNVLLSISKSDCDRVVQKKKQRLFELVLPPNLRQKSFLKEVQWDPLGEHILHLDFQAFTEGSEFEVDVPIKLKGEEECVGHKKEGVLRQLLQVVRVKGRLDRLPENIEVNVASLDIGQKIHVGDLGLNKDLKVLVSADSVVVMVVEARVEEEPVAAAAPTLEGGTSAEPEIIKPERKKETEEEEETHKG